MNLIERLRIQAQIERRFQAASISEVSPNPVDDIDLAADIIDSLPKAEDGSVITPDRWGVFINRNTGKVYHLRIQGTYKCMDGDPLYVYATYVYADADEWTLSEVLSTHRTCEEAEAAAKPANGRGLHGQRSYAACSSSRTRATVRRLAAHQRRYAYGSGIARLPSTQRNHRRRRCSQGYQH